MRLEAQVPMPAPTTMGCQPHTLDGRSVKGDQIKRLSHTHPLYNDDNAKFYRKMEEATRRTSHKASIKPFALARNGRSAYQSLMKQYAVKDKWQAMLSNAKECVQQRNGMNQ